MNDVLLELYRKGLEYNWSAYLSEPYQWVLLGSGISAALITTLSWCCGKDGNVKQDLEIKTLHYDIAQLGSELNKLKRNVDSLKVNYQQIVDFLKSDD